MVRVHSAVAREVSQHAVVLVIPVATRHARAINRAGNTRIKETRGERGPRRHSATTTSTPALHIGVTVHRLSDENYHWIPPPPPGYQRKRTRFSECRCCHFGEHTHKTHELNSSSSASCFEKQQSSSQLGSETMPDASPTRRARQPQPRLHHSAQQFPRRSTATVACEWRSPIGRASPCRSCGDTRLSAGDSTCSSSGTEVSITLVARKSPRRRPLQCHGDTPAMSPADVRMSKNSKCRAAAQHPLAKNVDAAGRVVQAAKPGEGRRPKTAPLAAAPFDKQPAVASGRCSEWEHAIRGHSGCFIPMETNSYQSRAQKAHAELAKKSGKSCNCSTSEPPQYVGDYYSKSIISMKMNPTDASRRIEKVCVRKMENHVVGNSKNCDKNITDFTGRRNETKGLSEMKSKYVRSADYNVPTGKIEVDRDVKGSCEDKGHTKKPEVFKGRRLARELPTSPRDSNPTTRRDLESGVPPVVSPVEPEKSARFLQQVTKSEEDLLKEISKVSKVVFMRHIDLPKDKTNYLKNRERKPIDPAPFSEFKVPRRVDSFTQTNEESAISECGGSKDETPADRELPDLPHEAHVNDQWETDAINNLTKNKENYREIIPEEVGNVLRNSSKFKSLRASSSDSMQKINTKCNETVQYTEFPGKPATPREASRAMEVPEAQEREDTSFDRGDLVPLLSSPPPSRRSSAFQLGRPKRPSGKFVSAMAREFEQSIANAASPMPREQMVVKGDDVHVVSTHTTVRLSEREITCSRRMVQRLHTTVDIEDCSHEEEESWVEPPLPALPARSKSLSPAKRNVAPGGKLEGSHS